MGYSSQSELEFSDRRIRAHEIWAGMRAAMESPPVGSPVFDGSWRTVGNYHAVLAAQEAGV